MEKMLPSVIGLLFTQAASSIQWWCKRTADSR